MHKGTHVTKEPQPMGEPGLRIVRQAAALTLSVHVVKIDARHWRSYAERWRDNAWHSLGLIGEYPSQAVALVEAGAWIERAANATAEDRIED